ncbi:MAG TPA: TonB-dependent receptor [Longimicrobium sp.]|jgi:outer membrane receptor protein involved in Fe transport|uniref:TonB-dependent receptor n=1 Tax=Longimicrobium sp. TaxID=2029185 RepID=UPI002ED7A1A3
MPPSAVPRFAAAVLLPLLCLPTTRAGAQADPSADSARAHGLAPVIVTAERSRTPLAASTAAVSVITGDELRRAPVRTLADALQRVPGLAFVDMDGLGLNPLPTVRGFYGGGEAEYVVLLVDGRPVGAQQTGVAPWELVPVSAVERVEVVRGGASSLYGDGVLGGVVNVVTRGEGFRGSRWSVAGGGAGWWRGAASAASPAGSAFADVQRTGGFRDHAARTAAVAGGALPLAVGRGSVTLSALNSWRDYREPGALTAAQMAASRVQSSPFFRFDRTDDRLHRLAADVAAPLGAWWLTGYLAGEYRHTDGVRTALLAPGFADGQARVADGRRLLGSAQADVALPGGAGRLLAGTDLSAGRVRSEYRPVASGGEDAFRAASGARGGVAARGVGERTAAGAFARYEAAPLPAVRLSLGARVDWLRDAFRPSVPDTAPALSAEHTAFSPRAGVNVRVLSSRGQEGHVYLAAGRSFKAATPDQLYDQRTIPVPFPPYGVTTSNPLLRPQHGTSTEAGLYHRAALGAGAKSEVSVAAYRMEMRDELDFDLQQFRYVNLGRSRHRGVEASARVGHAAGAVFATWTLQDVTSRTGETMGKALKAIPRNFASAGVEAGRAGGPSASLFASWAWGIWLDDANTRRLPAFARVDARLSYPVGRVSLTVDAFNLLDRSYATTGYMDPSGSDTAFYFPAARRTVQLGATATFP